MASREPGLREASDAVLSALKDRSVDRLLAYVDPDVRFAFGDPCCGVGNFRSALKLDDPSSPFWEQAQRVIENGWPEHIVGNQFCAPVGTQAVAEWQSDPTQPPVRRAFQYTNDGDVVVVNQEAVSAATESPNGADSAASAASTPQDIGSTLGRAEALYRQGQYKAAIAECDAAIRLDPFDKRAAQLQTQIRQTMQVLGIGGGAQVNAPAERGANTGLSVAKIVTAANPDVDVVSTDNGARAITLRNKKTGKVVRMTFEDAIKTLGREPAENTGGVFRVGPGVAAPQLLSKVEPQYSVVARSAKLRGTVTLYIEVDPGGVATSIRVVQGLGMGLDEKAIEAVKQWRFRPGYKDGKPVTVAAN